MHTTWVNSHRKSILSRLKQCARSAELLEGRIMHAHIIINDDDDGAGDGLCVDVGVATSIIDMYGKCGSLQEAHCIFDRMQVRTVVSWGAMMSGYVEHGQSYKALELFNRLYLESFIPDNLLFSFVLVACIKIGALAQGKQVHCMLLSSRTGLDVVAGNILIDLYVKWATHGDAYRVFHGLRFRSVVTWSAMISGCIHHGNAQLAFGFFHEMLEVGIMPDRVAFMCVLKACCVLGEIEKGRILHNWMIELELEHDIASGSTLVDMYAQCASLDEACRTFSFLRIKTVVSWSALIGGYAQYGCSLKALQLFIDMHQDGVEPDEVAFLCILKACNNSSLLNYGYLVHSQLIHLGLQSNKAIENSLVDMYSKCSSLDNAWWIFSHMADRTVVSWGAMIFGYAQQDQGQTALLLIDAMQHEGIECNEVIFISGLKACGSSQSIQEGKILHNEIVRNGFQLDIAIGSSLIDMYAKCGCVKDAQRIFDIMPSKNIISWGALMTGYVQHGLGATALDLFSKLLEEELKPGRATVLCCLMAGGSLGSIVKAHIIHDHLIRNENEQDQDLDIAIKNALLDMYIKCGSIGEGCQIFEAMPEKDLVSWGTIIAGYVHYGNHGMAMKYLQKMHLSGLTPNDVISTLMLATCSNAGLLKEGQIYFNSTIEHDTLHGFRHYGCVADLLTRTGHTIEGKELLISLPRNPDFLMWMSLLTSCRTYGNGHLGDMCFNLLDVNHGSTKDFN